MTSLDRIRSVALALPETEEREADGVVTFCVAGAPFAQFRDDDGAVVCVNAADADEAAMLVDADPAAVPRPADRAAGWVAIGLADGPDWALIEDRLARSWELAAPRGLLEAGGR